MTIRVLLFASYADALGGSDFSLELDQGSVVSDVVKRVQRMPGAESLPPQVLVAVNAEYATLHDVLGEGDEVAIIPPVAGG